MRRPRFARSAAAAAVAISCCTTVSAVGLLDAAPSPAAAARLPACPLKALAQAKGIVTSPSGSR